MLVVLSPAKSLDFDTPVRIKTSTQTQFTKQSAELIKLLRAYDVPALAELMHLSDKLATLNVARNHLWRSKFDSSHAKQAILAFDGDVYAGFAAKTLNTKELERAQQVIREKTSLYGLLKPLDLMQPYRLEMGT